MIYLIFERSVRAAARGIGGLLLISIITFTAAAQASEEREEGRKEAEKSSEVFREIMSKPDKAIPRELLQKAEAIGIFPDVVKVAFVVGGRGGDGVVARRMSNGQWGPPVFYNMGGASFGAQIGAKETDYIMLFMNEGALRDLLDDNLEFGGDLSFAAGPVGRTIGAGTNLSLNAGILTYSRSEGAFIGASLKGAVLTADNKVNEAIYGMKAHQVLDNPQSVSTATLPVELRSLMNALANHGGTSPTMAASNNVGNENDRFQTVRANYRGVAGDAGSTPRGQSRLVREVRHELLMMPYYSVFDWIEFDVSDDGVVTLNGAVMTPPDKKSAAERRVKEVEGVTRVVNNIRVLPLSPSDERIRQRLYREIYSGPLFRYQVGALQQIHIIVENGRVTLKGVVDSEADKNLAGVRARTVPGTFSIDNQLIVDGGREV